jgi:glycosyltransferase involved in cell wall biosynthesis
MACGCPAIISNQPAMVEVCGDAALQCNADDADELADLMRLVHDDPVRRAALIAAGRARAARFTWRATARKLLDICLAAAGADARVPTMPALRQAGESL